MEKRGGGGAHTNKTTTEKYKEKRKTRLYPRLIDLSLSVL